MSDNGAQALDLAKRNPVFAAMSGKPAKDAVTDESDEEVCPAFGYLRGMRDRALAIEFRLANGNSEFFPYSWLGPFRYNPSVGLLLRFTGDTLTLALIRGSNLNAPVQQGTMTLIDRGISLSSSNSPKSTTWYFRSKASRNKCESSWANEPSREKSNHGFSPLAARR